MIIFKEAIPAQLQHSQNPFFYNSLMHFRSTHFPVLEDDWHFFDFETEFPGSKFHFNLESVPEKPDFIEVNTFQYFFFIAHETCSSIFYRDPRDQPRIQRPAFRKPYPVLWPVNCSATFYIPGTDGYISPAGLTGFV